jgi:hypothetical protein
LGDKKSKVERIKMSQKFSLNSYDWKRAGLHLLIVGGTAAVLAALSAVKAMLPVDLTGVQALTITVISSLIDLAIRYFQG